MSVDANFWNLEFSLSSLFLFAILQLNHGCIDAVATMR